MAKGEKKNFVLAALKFWNLEKVFGLCAEKGKSICIRHPELPPKQQLSGTLQELPSQKYCLWRNASGLDGM